MLAGQWIFQRTDTKWGGANSSAFTNPLSGSGLDSAEVLAREAIQNSVDAFRPGEYQPKPRIVFRFRDLRGSARSDFVRLLFNRDEREDRWGLEQFSKIDFAHVFDDDRPLKLLYIEDFGTHGLHGHPEHPASHMRRLMLELGNDAKASGSSNSGGSYGYGKSVYLISGRHRFFVAHSRFSPEDDDRGVYSRLLGVGYFPEHYLNEDLYSGKAVFAQATPDEGWVPFEDDSATQVANLLGFSHRDERDTGTSILIVSPEVDADGLRRAIEKWWWPRLISDHLDIELVVNESITEPPRPRKRSYLRPYIECFDLLRGRAGERLRSDQRLTKLFHLNEELGAIALQLTKEVESEDDEETSDQKLGEIALFRKPEMVVKYYKVSRLNGACAGVFEASEMIDNILRLSENPAHTEWDANTPRLGDDQHARRLIRQIPKSIGKAARDFARSSSPQVPPSGLRVPAIESLIGRAIRLPRPGSIGGGNPAAPIRIMGLRANRCFVEEDLYTEGSVIMRLGDSHPTDSAICAIKVTCHPVEDSGISEDTPIPVTVLRGDGASLESGADGFFQVTLEKSSDLKLAFKSERYSRDWTVRVVPQAKVLANAE